MTSNKIWYHNSACITISTGDLSILCDPWLIPNAYYGTWGRQPPDINILDTIRSVDYIYISHIHPDHYCPESLRLLFNKYGPKPIVVCNWGKRRNILLRKLKQDGFGYISEAITSLRIGDTLIEIHPNITGSRSDIDSFLLVSDLNHLYTIVNLNDCNPSFHSLQVIDNHIASWPGSLFLCVGYTGAGPYPQTYYSPRNDLDTLCLKANEKKQAFFSRYKLLIDRYPQSIRLPFAGKYELKGPLSILNDYRGVADALEVAAFDPSSIVLDDGPNSFIDLISRKPSRQRKNPYEFSPPFLSTHSYLWNDLFLFKPTTDLLIRILRHAVSHAHKYSECDVDMFWTLYVSNIIDIPFLDFTDNPWAYSTKLLSFNTNYSSDPFSTDFEPTVHSHMFIEDTALLAVLLRLTHWNNYEVGSVFQVRRKPDIYHEPHQSYLNFLHI